MKEGDVFKRFRDSFDRMDGHFHILEQRVPVPTQMEYFKYSEQVRRARVNPGLAEEEYADFLEKLSDPEVTTDHKMYILSMLATTRQVKAYRMLEDYAQHPDDDVKDWAYMALLESRISLESELSDEKQIYISTGLGGKGEKLRFYVLMLSRDRNTFEEYQRRVIEREFAFYLEKANCVIERLTIYDEYVELVFLISVRADIKFTLDRVIHECNLYGNFLSGNFTITNVKEMTEEEVYDIILKNEDSKASY